MSRPWLLLVLLASAAEYKCRAARIRGMGGRLILVWQRDEEGHGLLVARKAGRRDVHEG